MAGPLHDAVRRALGSMRMSEMDPALLSFAILDLADELRIGSPLFRNAMTLAAYVHRTDRRGACGDLPRDVYITHPYRNVLRLLRYGCADEQILIAAALHDTVEDHPEHIVGLFDTPHGTTVSVTDAARALELLDQNFGTKAARIVAAVSNPPSPAGASVEQRHRAYAEHVAAVIGDPDVFLVKFVDFVDNAASLVFMTDEAGRVRRARKYAPLVAVLGRALDAHAAELPVSPAGIGRIRKHLNTIEERLAVLVTG
jgi:(p)ppGpp synthase/HD superfamily hydrolase